MRRRVRKRKCAQCKEYFYPDRRNRHHQQYCSKAACRKASKAASQKRWLEKPENRDYFHSAANVLRVQIWRKANPGYWRRKNPGAKDALQELLIDKAQQNQVVTSLKHKKDPALQDFISEQHIVLIGLIAQLTGSALQDDIDCSLKRMQQLGNDILNGPNHAKGGNYDQKTSRLSG